MSLGWIYTPIFLCHNLKQSTCKTWSRTAVNLSYKVIGEGHAEDLPIFILHGLLGSKKHWKGMGKTILNMTKRSVVIVDQRNHGGSPHINSHKYEEMATDMTQLLDKLRVRKASLVGHSMGGRTAMCVSLMAPERVAGILVVDISPVSTTQHLLEQSEILTAMKNVDFKSPKKVGRAKKEAKRQLKKLIKDDITMGAVLSNIKVKSDGIIGWSCNLDILIKHFKYIASFPMSMNGKRFDGPAMFPMSMNGKRFDGPAMFPMSMNGKRFDGPAMFPMSMNGKRFDGPAMFPMSMNGKRFDGPAMFPMSMNGKRFDGPAMFIGGQLSEYIPADDLTSIRELFPQAVITYIPGTGHNLHAEDPKSFLELAIAFLRTNHYHNQQN